MAATTTYIVIEVSEKENALDIVNVLMTHTKARFTIAKDICAYAADRGNSGGTSNDGEPKPKTSRILDKVEPAVAVQAPPPPEVAPVHIREESPEVEEIDAADYYQFNQMVPKTEQNDHPPEPYLQPTAQYLSPLEHKHAGYAQMYETPQQHTEATHPVLHYQQPGMHHQQIAPVHQEASSPHEYEHWPQEMDAVARISPTPRGGRKRGRAMTAENPVRSSMFKCALCNVVIRAVALDITKRSNHAIIHMDLKRYFCPFDKCDYGSRHRSNISSHVKTHHDPNGTKLPIPDRITPEQAEELKHMVLKCFPEMAEKLNRGQGTSSGFEFEEDFVEETGDE